MIDMNRLVRAVAAGAVGTTFLAVFLGICPCPEMAAALVGQHGCCRPETGLLAAERACCPSLSTVPKLVTAPEASVASTPVSLRVVPVERHDTPPTPRLSPPSIFSPPTVLRI
ncbi:MAG: hypothetical protein A2V74_00285 [Acidobacteria bacterium RBG_16_70_10]|nr:MAG: hypothetical protein A2V74_00285 [Acidobacteria bacterium RBG_16_70_10]